MDSGLVTAALVSLGTFAVSLLVAAFGPTGGLQLAIVAAVVPAPLTIPLHAWISSTSAIFRTVTLWPHILWRYFVVFAGASLLGSVVGLWAMTRVDGRFLEVVVGVAIIVSALRVSQARESRTLLWLSRAAPAAAATGFLTIFVGATGPLLFTLMSSRFRDRQELMATHSVCLTLQHLSKLVLFGSVGIAIFKYPLLLAGTTVASASGTFLGTRILPHTPVAAYRIVLCAFMLLSGTFVVIRALLR